MNEIHPNTCKGCNKHLKIDDSTVSDGYIVCLSCGTVADTYIEPTAEWRCYNLFNGGSDITMVRCGSAMEESESHVTDVEGSNLKMQKLHRWGTRNTRKSNLQNAHREFEIICRKWSLPDSILKAADQLFVMVYDAMTNSNQGIRRTKMRNGLRSACLYYACRQVGSPRSQKEISVMYEQPLIVVSKGCKYFAEIVGMKNLKLSPLTAVDFLPRFCQTLQIEYNLQSLLIKVVRDTIKSGCLGQEVAPINLAGAAIMWLCRHRNLSVTREQIILACGCSKIISRKICDTMSQWYINNYDKGDSSTTVLSNS